MTTGAVEMTHYWRIRKWHPEWFGRPCRVVARGKMNSVKVEFADGSWTITSRYFVRKLKPEGSDQWRGR